MRGIHALGTEITPEFIGRLTHAVVRLILFCTGELFLIDLRIKAVHLEFTDPSAVIRPVLLMIVTLVLHVFDVPGVDGVEFANVTLTNALASSGYGVDLGILFAVLRNVQRVFGNMLKQVYLHAVDRFDRAEIDDHPLFILITGKGKSRVRVAVDRQRLVQYAVIDLETADSHRAAERIVPVHSVCRQVIPFCCNAHGADLTLFSVTELFERQHERR